MAEGVVLVFQERTGHAAIFVSHQWAGHGHPDPDMEQFKVIQSFLSQLMEGKITAISGNILAELYLNKPRIPSKELRSFKLSVWYDYFSVPQAAEAVEERKKAIHSIPHYVGSCRYFAMLCPLVKHAQESTIMGKRSYMSRGWCRLELAARILSERESSQMIVEVHTSNHQVCSPIGDWILNPVGEGSFSVSQDLQHSAAVVTSMITKKLEHFLKEGDLHSFRVLLNLRGVIYRGLPAVPTRCIVPGLQSSATDPARHLLEAFLHENGLANALDSCSNGWTPLCYAVLGGSPLLVSALLEARANPHDCLRKTKVTFLPNIAGITVLQACIYLRHNEAAKVLISFRAEVTAKDCNGAEAIHWASRLALGRFFLFSLTGFRRIKLGFTRIRGPYLYRPRIVGFPDNKDLHKVPRLSDTPPIQEHFSEGFKKGPPRPRLPTTWKPWPSYAPWAAAPRRRSARGTCLSRLQVRPTASKPSANSFRAHPGSRFAQACIPSSSSEAPRGRLWRR